MALKTWHASVAFAIEGARMSLVFILLSSYRVDNVTDSMDQHMIKLMQDMPSCVNRFLLLGKYHLRWRSLKHLCSANSLLDESHSFEFDVYQ